MPGETDTVKMCNHCATPHKNSASGICQRLGCTGEVREYAVNGAAIMNALDCAGYGVREYILPMATDLRREIRVEFDDAYNFKPYEPPKAFVYNRGAETISADGKKSWTHTEIYKRYPGDMPFWAYVLQLAEDIASLAKWVFSLPQVKAHFDPDYFSR